MRHYILSFLLLFVSVLVMGNEQKSSHLPIMYSRFFPADIHKTAIVFEKFEQNPKKTTYGTIVYDLEADKVNELIQNFISMHPEYNHTLLTKQDIDSLPLESHKYLIRTKFMQFETQATMNRVAPYAYVYKSVFYVTDRTTGKEYDLFYSPKKQAALPEGKLPPYPPKDKQFFKALSDYILMLKEG